ncbi:MAG TPA: sulfotransferase domain-containing protein [Pyrinomonadaceae bacterium]|nr:sulfotransferase domain-containing protein [Pyrinomonadaceae bacterium]
MTPPQPFELSVEEEKRELALQIKADVDRGLRYLELNQADAAILAFKLAIEKSEVGSNVRDIVTHNLLTAYRKRIAELLKADDVSPVNRYTPEVSALQLSSELAQDKTFRGKFADTFKNLGMDFFNARQHEAALFFLRKAIAIESCPSYYVDLTNALAWVKTPAQLRDYTKDYTERDIGRHIFITCAPKSGSTFLKNVLVAVTDFKDVFSVFAALQNEHELDLPQFVKFGKENKVTQQHARASEANIQMMQAFGVKPIVLVRNIFDSTASLLDFYTKGFTFSTFFDKEEFLSFDDEQKIDLLIEFAIPWYFQFVASWQRAEREGRVEMLWLTYEEMIADKVSTVEKVLEFNGLDAPREIIEQKIAEIESDGEKNRFNKGVAGRGKVILSEVQKTRIANLAKYFPSTDFSMLGL